jgi:phage recombination protein Bet
MSAQLQTKSVQPLKPADAKPSAIQLMATRMSVEPAKLFETLKATVFQKATNEELMALIVVANTYHLNPFLKELYAFPAKGGGIVPVVSVDGWNSMLIRQENFDGIEFEFVEGNDGIPFSCTATIHVKNRSHPCRITEYYSECQRNTEPWKTMPHRMLRNRTLCQASRVAFGFSGIYHEEEADAITIESAIVTPQLPPPKTVAPAEGVTPQVELETLCAENGYTLEHVKKWGIETGNLEAAGDDFASIPTEVCRRLLRAKSGLLKGLEQIKAGEAK